ncbi:MAG: hypothetical protein ACRDPB_05690 [Nocardioidaceae bacterium]
MTGIYTYAELQQKRDEALDLAHRAQRESALAHAALTEVKGELREARLDLAVARELLAYHDYLPVEEVE